MQAIPHIEPITKFVRDHKPTLAKLDNGPIILTQNSSGAAVLVSIEQWNALVEQWDTMRERLSKLEAIVEIGDEVTQAAVRPEAHEELNELCEHYMPQQR